MAVSDPSPCLLAANQRLLELRAQAQAHRPAGTNPVEAMPVGLVRAGCGLLPWEEEVGPPRVTEMLAGLPAVLPIHLGWGSEALSRVLRQVQSRRQADEVGADGLAGPVAGGADHGWSGSVQGQSWPEPEPGPGSSVGGQFASGNGRFDRHDTRGHTGSNSADGASTGRQAENSRLPADVKLYPDIGLAMLRQEQTAAGRLWLLLRGLDGEGRGWLRVANIRQLLTKKSSKTYLCGWRQLRNLLRDGDDLYWTRDEERIWLRSAAKVAYGLGVARLSGRPVALPLEALVNGIGRFRAELYAAFHSSRVKTNPDGEAQAMPIARETLTNLSGVGETTQRRYEEQLERTETAVAIQPNFAIGHRASQKELEDRGWQQGNALFTLEDFRGQQGPKGRQYVAWQLPNSYTGSHQHRPQGRQRRINRQLKDLVMKGMPGNEGEAVDARQPDPARDKLYYPTGKLAAKAFNRRKSDNCYWRQAVTRNGRYAIWQHLEQNQRVSVGSHV
jgi:hypothetical protein